jgi:hypothetical protein
MATPLITSVAPASGPASGGDLVRLTGTGFGPRVAVEIGGRCQIVAVRREPDGTSVLDVRTPAHTEAAVDVLLQNLDEADQPIANENTRFTAAYRFLRSRLVREPDLTRLVRTVLRELKRQVIDNVSMATSVDYEEGSDIGPAIATAALPSLVVTGPLVSENRTYATNVPVVDAVATPTGPELRRRRPAFTRDLEFRLTGGSNGTAELLSLMAAVATFLNRNRWIEMARDPDNLSAGLVRWELDAVGEFRVALDSPDDVRAFTCGFVVRGFDIDQGLPVDSTTTVESPQLGTEAMTTEGAD